MPAEPGDTGDQPEPVDPDVDGSGPSGRGELRAPRALAVLLAVALGGVLGAEARYGLGVALPHGAGAWPWSTLVVNASGCLLIGVLMVLITERGRVHPLIRPLLGVGVLGGYTTFSSYVVDAIALTDAGRIGPALGYLAITPVLAVLAVAAGIAATRRLVPGGRP